MNLAVRINRKNNIPEA